MRSVEYDCPAAIFAAPAADGLVRSRSLLPHVVYINKYFQRRVLIQLAAANSRLLNPNAIIPFLIWLSGEFCNKGIYLLFLQVASFRLEKAVSALPKRHQTLCSFRRLNVTMYKLQKTAQFLQD